MREGGRWIFRPPPIDGELLSSWLLRLAKEYQKPPIVIVQSFSDAALGVLRNPDLSIKSEILSKIANALQIPQGKVEAASLSGMAINVGLDQTKKQIQPYWLVAARRGKGHQLASSPIQYCPQCLSEDEIPYFRKEWAFAFVVACKKHRAMLYQACPQCGTRNYYSGSWSAPTEIQLKNSVINCLACGGDLTMQKVRVLDGNFEALLSFQSALIKGAKQGQIDFEGFEGPSKELFRWLGQFARWLAGRKEHSYLAKYLQLKQPEFPTFAGGRIRIEHWEPSQRIVLMNYLSELFKSWPHNFLALTTKAKLKQELAKGLELSLSEKSKKKLLEQETISFRRRMKVWKESEIDLIRTLARQGMAAGEIAKRFESSEYAIRTQASNHKISLGKPRKLIF